MPVYLVRADNTVKIGYAHEDGIIARLGVIQTNNHVLLTLIRVFDGDQSLEYALQDHFAHLRLHHEWFTWVPEMEGNLGIPEWLPAASWNKPWPIMEAKDPALSERRSAIQKRIKGDPEYRRRMAQFYSARKAARTAKSAQRRAEVMPC
jgi:hypothetical protein